MAPSDSEDEGLEDLEFDGEEDAEPDIEEDAGADDATEEADDDSASEDSRLTDEVSDDEEDEYSEPSGEIILELDADALPTDPIASTSRTSSSQPPSQPSKAPSPLPLSRKRSLSPAQVRKRALYLPTGPGVHTPRSYTVEAICALPHPVPTHALASSLCMTHLLTGSDDGYIRDYDIFSAVNSKNFLTAPQRHHSGVVEGIMKSGQIRCWWENPVISRLNGVVPGEHETSLSPVYCLAMHSDALWTLAGTDAGHINLFTIRHEPGRLCHVMNGHRGPVSALSMDHDEKGFFSSGWDGEALQWDLNTGQIVRNFAAHGAQLAGIAVRPVNSGYSETNHPVAVRPETETSQSSTQSTGHSALMGTGSTTLISSNIATSSVNSEPPSQTKPATDGPLPLDSDAKSDASFDPLFDDEPDTNGDPDTQRTNASNNAENHPSAPSNPGSGPDLAMPNGPQSQPSHPPARATAGFIAPPKNAPPLLDSATYATYSPDLLLTASIDGQIILWDKRVHTPGKGVGRLWMSEKTPPWCLSACWSADGAQIYAGRRNGTVDVWDVRQVGRSGPSNTPRLLKTLRNPLSSGVVSCVVAFPDGRHIACASIDNLRLWNVAEAAEPDAFGKMKSGVQFKIIPGHHGGYISQMLVDPGARFLVSASSNRGWHGDSTRTVFVHDIKHVQ